MKFLQLNLGRGKEAQDLLIQTAREREADVSLISEQHKWSENFAWYHDASRRAGILACSPVLSIGKFLETDARIVWVELADVVCKAATSFSTNLSRSSKPRYSSLRKASERLVGGPLLPATLTVSRPSGEKPAWTGILVGEVVARNDLYVLNRSMDFTFR